MNQSGNETGSMNLPAPVTEQAPQSVDQMEAGPSLPETAPLSAEAPKEASAPAAVPPPLPLPLPSDITGVTDVSDDDTRQTKTSVGKVIEDKDLIEREWVDRAKAIVEKTRDDPYRQSEELTTVKAEYLQRQYNKTLKLNK